METTAKINKTKSWCFEKINRIDNLLARLTKKKKEKFKSITLEMKKKLQQQQQIEIQRIIRDYYEQLYANKMDNLGGKGQILKKYNLPRLNQEAVEKTNITNHKHEN